MNPDLLLTPKQFCNKFSACAEGGEFATNYATMREVWEACPNPRWLMWICAKLGTKLDDKTDRLFACWCVRNTPLADGRTTWDLLTDDRSRYVVEVAERFADGLATGHELSMARAAAEEAVRAAAGEAERAAAEEAVRAGARAGARAARAGAWAAQAAEEAARAAAEEAARAAAEGAAAEWSAAEWSAAAWRAAAASVRARAVADAAQANELRNRIANPFPL